MGDPKLPGPLTIFDKWRWMRPSMGLHGLDRYVLGLHHKSFGMVVVPLKADERSHCLDGDRVQNALAVVIKVRCARTLVVFQSDLPPPPKKQQERIELEVPTGKPTPRPCFSPLSQPPPVRRTYSFSTDFPPALQRWGSPRRQG